MASTFNPKRPHQALLRLFMKSVIEIGTKTHRDIVQRTRKKHLISTNIRYLLKANEIRTTSILVIAAVTFANEYIAC